MGCRSYALPDETQTDGKYVLMVRALTIHVHTAECVHMYKMNLPANLVTYRAQYHHSSNSSCLYLS